MNRMIHGLTDHYAIVHKKSTTYYPKAKGLAESTNKTLQNILKKIVNDHRMNWILSFKVPYGHTEQVLKPPSIYPILVSLWTRRRNAHRVLGFELVDTDSRTPSRKIFGAVIIVATARTRRRQGTRHGDLGIGTMPSKGIRDQHRGGNEKLFEI